MTEWRRKTYYRPRVLVESQDVLTPVSEGILICLEPEHLALLRPMMQYLHRRSTFVSDYDETSYYVPDESDWDTIQATVAELEGMLMGGCDDIVMALDNLTAQVACLCSNSAMPAIGQAGPGYNQVVDTYLTDGTVVIEDDNGGTIPIDTERCALAQLTYAAMFEWMDETAIPLQEQLASILLPAAVLAVGAAMGVTLVGIPVALITATLISLGEIAVDNQLSNLVNALIANKEEIVCALYNGLETDYQTAHREVSVVIDGMESIGFTDKQIAKALMAPWAITKAKSAMDAGTSWATSNVESGYCVQCEDIIEGDGWFAVGHNLEIEINHPSDGGYWERVSACGPFYATNTVIGFVLETLSETGDCNYVTDQDASDCTGTTISVNSSSSLVTLQGYYFCQELASIDEDAVIAALFPGAVKLSNQIQHPVTGPGNWRITVRGGYGCDGSATFSVRYVVYQGTP